MRRSPRLALSPFAAVLAVGLLVGLTGLRWGLPGPQRLRAFPERLLPTPEIAQKLADSWARLYDDIKASHREMKSEEPVTYVRGVDEIAPDWAFPPPFLANSYRSLLVQTEHPDEKKAFIILSQMRPWRFEFRPLYIQYGGAFVYPLGAFLKAASILGAVTLTPDLRHYLERPEDMGRAYLVGRLFVLIFHLGSLWMLFDMGRTFSGWRTGVCAALFYALCPVVLINSHILKPHAYAAFWALACARRALKASERGSRRDYLLCGAWAGLAAGANFTLVMFGGLPVLAWLGRRLSRKAKAAELRWGLAGTALVGGVFVALNPYLAVSFRDFAWELFVYSAPKQGSASIVSWDTWLAFCRGVGPLLGPLIVAALLGSCALPGTRRWLAFVTIGVFLILWMKFSRFADDPDSWRLYLPLLGLGCLLLADRLCAGPWPGWVRGLAVAALLADAGLRAGVYLVNMKRDVGPNATRLQAAAWIEAHVPAGARIGLTRYPEPAHTPPFRYDRYHLVVFDRPESLSPGQEPAYVAVDEDGRGLIDNWPKNKYDLIASFVPSGLGWVNVEKYSLFINAGMHIYKRREAPQPES